MRIQAIVLGLALTGVAMALAAPPASAAVGDATNGQNSVCWIPAGTPLGDSGAECTRGTVTGTLNACTMQGGVWGCDIHATASDAQDPLTCGYTAVMRSLAVSHGCWDDALGIPSTPTPVSANTGWLQASPDPTGVWHVKIPATVEIHDVTNTVPPQSVDWEVLIEVPAPPSGSSGCPANGSSASASAGIFATGASAFLPSEGLAVQEYVYPLQLIPPPGAALGYAPASTEVEVHTATVAC